MREAQATHFASVQSRFFDQLGEDEIAVLASVFSRFATRGPDSCTAATDSCTATADSCTVPE